AYLVERHLGFAVRQKALEILQVERARAPSDPQPRFPLELDVRDDRVRRALLIMEQSIAEPIPIAAIAARCGLSTRGLERVFMQSLGMRPTQAYADLRLRIAKEMVIRTRKSMTDIGLETGFQQPSH